ncbi:hypothetical protein KC19_5G141200 [Ceratodon purpureus]|uniref:F-box domain-containing protein n=1 Tax=Ceratodon purpureus TaxID=3225 RepID=A0A8T0I2Q4_CERPU|nr:hypothetical protein KC19_5G141200 [Ceratodon purpureus]KAG0577235.1 hypothetical protein KC19_5G141200 [Ceratodon purpureus]
MSIPCDHSMESLFSLVSNLSLWQLLIFSGWVLSLLVQKLAGATSSLLWQLFVDSLFCELQDVAGAAWGRVWYLSHEGDVGEGPASSEAPIGSLIPVLPDCFVAERVWPVVATSPLSLVRLRLVSKRWKTFVDTTVEWHALSLVLWDFPGLRKYASGGRSLIAMTRRLRIEVANFRLLLLEDMAKFETRLRCSRVRNEAVPSYVSTEDCPPDADECPEYYEL